MQVITLNEQKFRERFQYPLNKRLVIAMGYFDGVHLGHQQLIHEAKKVSKEQDALTAVVTFWPNPNVALGKSDDQSAITPLQMKERVMAHYGVDVLITVEFSQWLRELPPQQFMEHILVQLPVAAIVVGFDFRFGKGGIGNIQSLQAIPYPVYVVPAVVYNNLKIGSTNLRQSIRNGEIELANTMLGRCYEVSGVVMNGLQNGRKLGFPTVNLALQEQYVLPSTGVYAVRICVHGKWYKGMANVGHAPTIRRNELTGSLGNEFEPLIEVHIFNFDQSIYGESVRVQFVKKMRDEQKFKGVDWLIRQLHEDKSEVEQYFSDLINS